MWRTIILACVASACSPSERNIAPDAEVPLPRADAAPVPELPDAMPAIPCNSMDIIFIVDDSPSMDEEQQNLALNFPEFARTIDEFENLAGDALDYRIAVTTTGRDVTYTAAGVGEITQLGANGAFLFDEDCGMTRRWFERGDPELEAAFACVAEVGTDGPSVEMPLEAAYLALSDRIADGTNDGFVREDSLLALVVLTDEDDCSRQDNGFSMETGDACSDSNPEVVDVEYYMQFLDELKSARGRWAAAVIAGPGPGLCTSGFGVAYEARRLHSFVDQTGDAAVFSSICDGDLTIGLRAALDTFNDACNVFPPVP